MIAFSQLRSLIQNDSSFCKVAIKHMCQHILHAQSHQFDPQHCTNWGTVIQACSLSTQEMETGGSEIQSHPQLEARLKELRLCPHCTWLASFHFLPENFRFKEASRLVLNVASLGAAAPHRISFLFQPPTAP